MSFINDLLNSILDVNGKKSSVRDGLDTARITSVGANGISLRTPNGNGAAALAKGVGSRLGIDFGDIQNRETSLNLDGQMQRGPNGRLRIDFRSLGGSLFEGTEKELGELRGQALIDTVGQQTFNNNSSGIVPVQSSQGNIPQILGTSAIAQGRQTTRLDASSIQADTNSLSNLTSTLQAGNKTGAVDLNQLKLDYQSLTNPEDKANFRDEFNRMFFESIGTDLDNE